MKVFPKLFIFFAELLEVHRKILFKITKCMVGKVMPSLLFFSSKSKSDSE